MNRIGRRTIHATDRGACDRLERARLALIYPRLVLPTSRHRSAILKARTDFADRLGTVRIKTGRLRANLVGERAACLGEQRLQCCTLRR